MQSWKNWKIGSASFSAYRLLLVAVLTPGSRSKHLRLLLLIRLISLGRFQFPLRFTLPNHSVRPVQRRLRNRHADLLRSLDIDDQLRRTGTRRPTCLASSNLGVKDGYLLRRLDIPDKSCERLPGRYSFFWRRDFSQLHFGHDECQSRGRQRSPGEFLKRL